MRSRRTAAVAAATTLALALAAPAWSAEAPVEDQLQRMEDRMRQMEERLQAATDQLEDAQARAEAQQELLEGAGITEGRGVSNGLTDFVNALSIGGWIAGSWAYNFNNPDGDSLNGANSGSPGLYPFHPDANSFSFDQLWFEIGREADEEHRAGFYVELAYGKTSGLLSGNAGGDGFSGNDFDVYAAYVEYLAPVLDGVNFKFGKFGTLIGAEVAQAPYNFNITRGNVYQLFQPFTHVGILASSDVGPLSITFGGVNETRSFPAADVDNNNNKALLWSLAYDMSTLGLENVGLSFNGTWGQSPGGGTPAGDKETIFDVILSWDPTENFSTYINADYISTDDAQVNTVTGATKDIDGYGIAWASRYAINDRTGLSFRYEFVHLNNFFAVDQDLDKLHSVTGTLDYLLTNNLMMRGELRWDRGDDDADNDLFISNDTFTRRSQVVGLLEVLYKFDGFGE